MKYWDTSALVPLIIGQAPSCEVEKLAQEDPDKSFWWGARVECASALARLERVGLPFQEVSLAYAELEKIFAAGTEIQPSDSLRATAARLLRVHPLRAGDALQLAAAIHGSEGHPESLDFVCTDIRLVQAASKEGFRVIP